MQRSAGRVYKDAQEYRDGKSIGGLTPAQRFFVGWSISWMTAIRPESMRQAVKTDVHAPSPMRAWAPLTNLPQFYQAYGVKAGDKMYRAENVRVKIW